jgi:ketosteroid isomerase-like protein
MDDTYLINTAKTEFREAYNSGDVEQLLSVFDEEGFTDMSEDGPSLYDDDAREGLRRSATGLFAQYDVKLTVIVIKIIVAGDLAYDYGWHEFTLRPKGSEETLRKRHRYLEVWRKNSSGQWRIASFINNADVREELDGHTSHWFLSEEHGTVAGDPVR